MKRKEKKEKKKAKRSPAQRWAAARNRAKGQLSFMRGTAKSAIGTNALTKKEEATLHVISETLFTLLDSWEHNSSEARQRRLDTWD
jgi:hypothetical protein